MIVSLGPLGVNSITFSICILRLARRPLIFVFAFAVLIGLERLGFILGSWAVGVVAPVVDPMKL